jgi:hypothetical protein
MLLATLKVGSAGGCVGDEGKNRAKKEAGRMATYADSSALIREWFDYPDQEQGRPELHLMYEMRELRPLRTAACIFGSAFPVTLCTRELLFKCDRRCGVVGNQGMHGVSLVSLQRSRRPRIGESATTVVHAVTHATYNSHYREIY